MENISNMLVIASVAVLIVLGAMIVDLISGLYKAKIRGEVRSSWGLKRTLTKFITYEGGMSIAIGIDTLLHLSNLEKVFHLDALEGVPLITCLLGVFLLVVEFISVREAADEKTKTELSRVSEVATKIISKDEMIEILTKALTNALNSKTNGK